MQNVTLPLPTRIILGTSDFIRGQWPAVILALVAATVLFFVIRQSTTGRRVLDAFVIKIPVFGELVRDVNMARIVTYLSLFYRTGVDLVLALKLVERIIDNRAISDAVGKAREMITEGVSMTSAFGGFALFPPIVIRAIALGEATGNLDQSLGRAKDYYAREIPASVRRMITVLQPLLIAVLGGVILMVALAIVLPILNIYNQIGVRR
jgi:type IV pilus assembly protein PilC